MNHKIITIGDIRLHKRSPFLDYYYCWRWLVINHESPKMFIDWYHDMLDR